MKWINFQATKLKPMTGQQSKQIHNNTGNSVIESLLTKKHPGPDGFTTELYQTFKELQPIILTLFKRVEIGGTFLNLFYESVLLYYPNQVKTQQQ